jgi:hypothetical protein
MIKVGIRIIVSLGLIGLASFLIIFFIAHAQSAEIKNKTISFPTFSETYFTPDSPWPLLTTTVDQLELAKKADGNYESERIYLSKRIDGEFIFNALGAHWHFNQLSGTSLRIEMRVKDNQAVWSDWQKFEASDLVGRDDQFAGIADKTTGEAYSDLIMVEDGVSFQYRVTLKTAKSAVTPILEEIEFNYIDSLSGPRAPEFESGWFKKTFAEETSFQGAPTVISRTDWGCPEGETSPGWQPETASKSYQVYHHTVTSNGAEPYSTMRAIWYYHAKTRGWGDIGYNYVVDQYGHIFKGRNGPKNVIGAHVYGHNTHSIGVAVLGDYVSTVPPSKALSGLSSTLAYSAYLNDTAIKLYGHRELTATQCPGTKLFGKKSDIVSAANVKLASYPDAYLLINNNTYYYLKDSQIRQFPNGQMARDWGFDLSKAIPTSDEQIAQYQLLLPIKIFARFGTSYYLVSNGVRHIFTNDFNKNQWGVTDQNSLDVTNDLDLLQRRTSRGIAASRFIKFTGSENIYVIENQKLRFIPTRIFNYRHFSRGLIMRVSSNVTENLTLGAIYPYPKGTLIREKGHSGVYYSFGNQKRIVSSAAFKFLHYHSRKIIEETSSFITALETGPPLLFSPGKILKVRINGADNLYLVISHFKRKYIPHETVMTAWGYGQDDVVAEDYSIFKFYHSSSQLVYPSGVLIRGDSKPSIYFIDLGQRRFISLEVYNAWGFADWENTDKFIDNVPQPLVYSLPHAGDITLPDKSIMYCRYPSGSLRYFYIQSDQKRYMPSTDIYKAHDFRTNPKYYVSKALTDVYPSGENLYYPSRMLIRGKGRSGVYYIEANQKRPMSSAVFRSWKFDPDDIRDISTKILDMIPQGPNLGAKKLTSILGPYGAPIRLPANSGKVCREQHLWLVANETAAHHYAVSGTPTDCRNGMAGGYGAFGSPASISQERYYVNMRWGYGDDMTLKSWYRHKKLIVTNPNNGKEIVVSIEEYGPASWTGRVAGLSPEAMKAIGVSCNDNLTYYWAGSQALSLGLID